MEMEKLQKEYSDIYKKKLENKIYNYWYIFLATFFGVFNCIFSNNINMKYLIFIQFFAVIFFIIQKQIKKAYLYHCIFLITSINFHNDLRLIAEGNTIIYNYSKLKLYGNISFSYLIIVLFFICRFLIKKKINKTNDRLTSKRLRKFMKIIVILFLTSISIGMMGVILDDYSFSYFIQNFLYFFHILVDLYFLINLYDKRDVKILKELIYSLLIATILVSIICTVIGFSGSYGGVKKLASLDIYGYTPVLIFLLLSKNNYLIGILGIISIYIGKDIFNGKEVASTTFILLIFVYMLLKYLFSKTIWKRKRSFLIIQILLIAIFLIEDKIMLKFENSKLLKSKFYQFISLFSIYDNFNNIPNSPKIRIIQLINIFLEYIKKPYMIIFGLGSGSYYQDPYNLFDTVNITSGAYNLKELSTQKYVYTHDTYSTLFKQHGIFGIYFLIKWLFYFGKSIKFDLLSIIPFLWLSLIYGFNNYQIILFVMIVSFVVFIETEKYSKGIKNEKNIINRSFKSRRAYKL